MQLCVCSGTTCMAWKWVSMWVVRSGMWHSQNLKPHTPCRKHDMPISDVRHLITSDNSVRQRQSIVDAKQGDNQGSAVQSSKPLWASYIRLQLEGAHDFIHMYFHTRLAASQSDRANELGSIFCSWPVYTSEQFSASVSDNLQNLGHGLARAYSLMSRENHTMHILWSTDYFKAVTV